MKIKEKLNLIIALLDHPNNEALALSLNHVHGKDIFSLVIDGNKEEFGNLTRIFICDRKLKPFDVQYHTHRYSLTITSLAGSIKHHLADRMQSGVTLPLYDYKSPLNGGNGLSYIMDVTASLSDNILPVGSIVHLAHDDYHTMSCSKGSMWMVEEHGFEKDYSNVIGMPFITDGLYKSPEMFQINDMCQRVRKQVQSLLTIL